MAKEEPLQRGKEVMAISQAAKASLARMTAAEKKSLSKAARILADAELMGFRRAAEIMRWCKK